MFDFDLFLYSCEYVISPLVQSSVQSSVQSNVESASHFIILLACGQINKIHQSFYSFFKKKKSLQMPSKIVLCSKYFVQDTNIGILRFDDDNKRAAVAHHLKRSVLFPKGLSLNEVIIAASTAVEQRAVESGFLEVIR